MLEPETTVRSSGTLARKGRNGLGSHDLLRLPRQCPTLQYDASGNHVWTRQFGTGASDLANGVAVDGARNAYVVGRTGGALPGQSWAGSADAFVRKYDAAGNERWTRQFGSAGFDSTSGVTVDSARNVYSIGSTVSAPPSAVCPGRLRQAAPMPS